MTTRDASTLWIMLFTLASAATTLIFACATPFSALAALAATHMRRRDGVALMLASWLMSQAIGFGLLGYPHKAKTIAWGVFMATAAVGSVLGADAILGRVRTGSMAARLAIGFVAAFGTYKLILLLWTVIMGDAMTAYMPAIVAKQALRDGVMLVGLYALYRVSTVIGVPPVRGDMRAAA